VQSVEVVTRRCTFYWMYQVKEIFSVFSWLCSFFMSDGLTWI
jgi:hypothetical protein